MAYINHEANANITLKRNGNILLGLKVIGTWSVSHPRKEMESKGFSKTYCSQYVDSLYEARINDREIYAYTQNEMRDKIYSHIVSAI